MFVQLLNAVTSQLKVIHDLDAGVYIPVDPRNPRYKAYLAWVAAGNAPQTQSTHNIGS